MPTSSINRTAAKAQLEELLRMLRLTFGRSLIRLDRSVISIAVCWAEKKPSKQELGGRNQKRRLNMEVKTPDGTAEYTSVPDTCPLCNHGIEPKFIGSNFKEPHGASRHSVLELIFRCPRLECQEAFIGYYAQQQSRSFVRSGPYYLEGTAPYNVQPQNLPPEVEEISGNFVLTYTQAPRHGTPSIGPSRWGRLQEITRISREGLLHLEISREGGTHKRDLACKMHRNICRRRKHQKLCYSCDLAW